MHTHQHLFKKSRMPGKEKRVVKLLFVKNNATEGLR
jgi:hypothetical protein